MKFRKKPVEIEAEQLTWQTWSDVCNMIGEFPEGMRGCYVVDGKATYELPGGDPEIGLEIPTLEGTMLAQQGDWIIKGIAGEFYPCKPEIFEHSYEKVE